jgi:hypothetical protein
MFPRKAEKLGDRLYRWVPRSTGQGWDPRWVPWQGSAAQPTLHPALARTCPAHCRRYRGVAVVATVPVRVCAAGWTLVGVLRAACSVQRAACSVQRAACCAVRPAGHQVARLQRPARAREGFVTGPPAAHWQLPSLGWGGGASALGHSWLPGSCPAWGGAAVRRHVIMLAVPASLCSAATICPSARAARPAPPASMAAHPPPSRPPLSSQILLILLVVCFFPAIKTSVPQREQVRPRAGCAGVVPVGSAAVGVGVLARRLTQTACWPRWAVAGQAHHGAEAHGQHGALHLQHCAGCG